MSWQLKGLETFFEASVASRYRAIGINHCVSYRACQQFGDNENSYKNIRTNSYRSVLQRLLPAITGL